MALAFGSLLLCLSVPAVGERLSSRLVPATLLPIDVVPVSVAPAPWAVTAAQRQAELPFVDRPRPLDEGIRAALELGDRAGDVLQREAVFSGVPSWDSSVLVSELNGGQKLEGLWETKQGPDQWTFDFEFGDFGMLQCIAIHDGDSYMIKNLGADFDDSGEYKGVTSAVEIFNSQGRSKAGFSFQLNEKSNPWKVTAQIRYADGSKEEVTALRPPK